MTVSQSQPSVAREPISRADPAAEEPAARDLNAMFAGLKMPTEEELHASCLAQYERVAFTFIDQWPDDIRALSFPTTLIPVDASLMRDLFDERGYGEGADRLAADLDAAMGWRMWFVRLNSRSPKDASYPEAPVTCAGKQAVWWLSSSERVLDDTTMFYYARKPMFVCLREYEHLWKDAEFRCFAKGGEVIGVSRYFYDEPSEGEPDPPKLWDNARRFYDTHLAKHYPEVVFDLHAPGSERARLIEINPYGLSNPCCFSSYAEIEELGGVRLRALPVEPSAPVGGDGVPVHSSLPPSEPESNSLAGPEAVRSGGGDG